MTPSPDKTTFPDTEDQDFDAFLGDTIQPLRTSSVSLPPALHMDPWMTSTCRYERKGGCTGESHLEGLPVPDAAANRNGCTMLNWKAASKKSLRRDITDIQSKRIFGKNKQTEVLSEILGGRHRAYQISRPFASTIMVLHTGYFSSLSVLSRKLNVRYFPLSLIFPNTSEGAYPLQLPTSALLAVCLPHLHPLITERQACARHRGVKERKRRKSVTPGTDSRADD